jgi:hypothetical protein
LQEVRPPPTRLLVTEKKISLDLPDSAPPGIFAYSYTKDQRLPDVLPLIEVLLRSACPTKLFTRISADAGNADVHFSMGAAGMRFEWNPALDRHEAAALGKKLSIRFLLRHNPHEVEKDKQFLPDEGSPEAARYQRIQIDKNAHLYTVDYRNSLDEVVNNFFGVNPKTRDGVAKLVREKVCGKEE